MNYRNGFATIIIITIMIMIIIKKIDIQIGV